MKTQIFRGNRRNPFFIKTDSRITGFPWLISNIQRFLQPVLEICITSLMIDIFIRNFQSQISNTHMFYAKSSDRSLTNFRDKLRQIFGKIGKLLSLGKTG